MIDRPLRLRHRLGPIRDARSTCHSRRAMNRPLGLTAAAIVALMVAGCAVSSTTLIRPDQGGSQVIYRISEEQAFTTALEAYTVLTPKQSVGDIVDGQRRGYNADERKWMDWWSIDSS